MSKLLTATAAVVTIVTALSAPGFAAERQADGARNTSRIEAGTIRHHRVVRDRSDAAYATPHANESYDAYAFNPVYDQHGFNVRRGSGSFGFGF